MVIEAKWKSRGIRVGKLPCGPLDKISDVPGVTVGHCTLADGEVQTGVTALLPQCRSLDESSTRHMNINN